MLFTYELSGKLSSDFYSFVLLCAHFHHSCTISTNHSQLLSVQIHAIHVTFEIFVIILIAFILLNDIKL